MWRSIETSSKHSKSLWSRGSFTSSSLRQWVRISPKSRSTLVHSRAFRNQTQPPIVEHRHHAGENTCTHTSRSCSSSCLSSVDMSSNTSWPTVSKSTRSGTEHRQNHKFSHAHVSSSDPFNVLPSLPSSPAMRGAKHWLASERNVSMLSVETWLR